MKPLSAAVALLTLFTLLTLAFSVPTLAQESPMFSETTPPLTYPQQQNLWYGAVSTFAFNLFVGPNYERLGKGRVLGATPAFRTGLEFCTFGFWEDWGTGIAIPVSGKLIWGQQKHHIFLEAGAYGSIDFSVSGSPRPLVYPIGNLGYRYQAPNKPFMFQAMVGTTGLGIGMGMAF